jgi:hypothetical protein
VVPKNPDANGKVRFAFTPSILARLRIPGALRVRIRVVPLPCALPLEILALRHQLGVLHRSAKRPKLTAADRLYLKFVCVRVHSRPITGGRKVAGKRDENPTANLA